MRIEFIDKTIGTVMAQWLGVRTENRGLLLPAARPRYGLIARDILIKRTTFQLSQTTIIGG